MTYQDLPVFPLSARLDAAPDYQLVYDPRRIELGFGAQPPAPAQSWAHRILGASFTGTQTERRSVEAFATGLRGREGAFWLPGLLDLGTFVSSAAADTLVVTGQDLATAFAAAPAMHVWILRADGTEEATAVTAVTTDGTLDTLTFYPALAAPLTAADLVCRLFLVRLADPALEWAIEGQVCRGSFQAVETPTDYSAIPTLSGTVPVWLFRFVKRVTRSQLYELRLTSAPFTVTDTDEAVWTPAPIDFNSLSLSTQGNEDSAEIQLYAFDNHPFADWEPRHWGWPMEVWILRGQADSAGELAAAADIVLRGEVKSATRVGKVITASLRSPLARETRVPRFAIQTRCNHVLFEPNTCQARAADFELTGTVAGVDSAAGTIDFECVDLDGKAADWLVGGRVEIGTGMGTQIRAVRATSVLSSTRHRLILNIALTGVEVDDTLAAWPGCDRTPSACATKFSNFSHFGGFPFVPADNPAIKALELVNADVSGGKK